MKYYFIRQPSDKAVIGINDGGPQAEVIDSRWENKRSLKEYYDFIKEASRLEGRIDNDSQMHLPRIEYAKARNNSILTDFLSFSDGYGIKYLVSLKVKNILESYNANAQIFSHVGLYHRDKKIKEYYFFYLRPIGMKVAVNFERSTFFTGSKLAGTKKLHYVNGLEEYQSKKLVYIEKLCIKNSVIAGKNMFTIATHSRIYVSEILKDAFLKEKVTGINFLEPDEPTLQID